MTLFQLFKNLFPYVKKYKWLIVLALALTLVGSFTAQVNALVMDYTVNEITELITEPDPMSRGMRVLTLITIILFAKEIINVLITFGQQLYGQKLRIYIARDLSDAVIERILSYRMSFFAQEENESGKLQTRITRGVSSLTRLVQNFFISLLPLFMSSFVALILMFQRDWRVGLVGLAIIPVYVYIIIKQANTLQGWRREMRGFYESKSQGIIELVQSMNVIKSFNREDIEFNKQSQIQFDMTENQLQTQRTSYLFNGIKSFVEQVGVVIIIILTSYLVLKGELKVGAIMMYIMLFRNVTSPIGQLHRIFDDMNDALIYSESFFGILNADEEIEHSGSYKPKKVHGKFEMKNVDFAYPNGTKALFDVNMEIVPNKITAFVGLSGAGKSTVLNLLDKFYEPGSGEVLLDGVPLKDYDTQFLRDNIGLVLQKNHIFSGSVEENIRYGKPNATKEEIYEAAKQAYIYDQIVELPHGFETNAQRLSGGQQQRVAIARMFLKNPPIIFLDEPTASLDAIATEQIKNSLDAIKKDRTVIIVSHSISQIIDADQIYAMELGKVVESGTHEEAYAQDGVYKDIFDAMARSLNIEKIAETYDNK